MRKVAAVVLAAGLSRRMGEANKLLLPVGGQPMIVRTLRAYVDCCDDVIVVTGHDAQAVSEVLRHFKLRLIHNPDFERGQATSVAAGLRSAAGADHVLVGLGDQPLLRRKHLDELIRAHIRTGGAKITVPHNGNARGNPILIPADLVDKMLMDQQNPGCGRFTRDRPDLVDLLPLSAKAYFQDVDTPADYAAISAPMPASEGVQ